MGIDGESILNSVKAICNIPQTLDAYDAQIISHINTVFIALDQMGIGPNPGHGFRISDNKTTWSDYLGDKGDSIGSVKDYVGIKVRLMFDPPSNSYTTEALEKSLHEIEWRLSYKVDADNAGIPT